MRASGESFRQQLLESLESYIPDWADRSDLGISTRTIHRWIAGENSPSPRTFDVFLDKVSKLNNKFPQKDLQALLSEASEEKSVKSDIVVGEYMSVDGYDFQFNAWCSFAQQEIAILQNWMSYRNKLTDNLVEAVIKRGIPVKILLAQPNSEYVKIRLRQRRTSPSELLAYIEDFKHSILAANLQMHANFQVRFYNNIPPFALYMVDKNILLGQYWYKHIPSAGPFLHISSSTMYSEHILRSFQDLWNDAESPENLIEYLTAQYRSILHWLMSRLEIASTEDTLEFDF